MQAFEQRQALAVDLNHLLCGGVVRVEQRDLKDRSAWGLQVQRDGNSAKEPGKESLSIGIGIASHARHSDTAIH